MSTGVAALAIGSFQPAFAQDGASSSEVAGDDIIVTARKRDETSIAVPVALTAIGSNELQRRAINTIDGMARVVPSLIVGENAGLQGGIVAIRGIAGADANPLGEQAVSFNIDGVQVARATVRRMSEMDIQQVEVLKGPQALFFGKNSPGGIISIRTADPTPDLQAKIQAGYEFKAHEIRTEGYISAPLSDTLGIRVAGSYSDMRGYLRNGVPRNVPGIFAPSKHAPNKTDWAGRVTLKWTPSDRFNARLKVSYSDVDGSSQASTVQIVACPLGVPQGSTPLDTCKADGVTYNGDFGPSFGRVNSTFGDGHSFFKQHQILSGLEMNYEVTDALTLTSVTGYYKARQRSVGNFTNNYLETGALPKQVLGTRQGVDLKELTEELRLASSFDGPFNFMIGGLYQKTRGLISSRAYRNLLNPTFVVGYTFRQKGEGYSLFGQAMLDILPTLELSAGGRYSHEEKKLPDLLLGSMALGEAQVQYPGTALTKRQVKFNNFSPEITLSYRPDDRLTIYGSWKKGFLSGGFSAVPPPATGRIDYDQQTVRGFEAGIKALLLDGALRTNLSLYNYKTNGLQVTVTTQGVNQELRNAGSVRTKGIEFDANWRTPLEGLSLSGAMNYNRGRYIDYQASCYRGQSSDTCFFQLNRLTGETALLQDLSGQPLVRAPKWTGNVGFNYETPVGSGMKLGLSGNGSFSSGYFGDTINAPGGFQKSYQLFDATVRVAEENDMWEVALIGRNLTNEWYWVRSTDIPFTGTNPGCSPARAGSPANCTGASVTNPVLGDTAAAISRGREIMLRFSYKFGG